MGDKVDFLPEDYVEKKTRQRTNIVCLTLFLVVMGGVACGFIVTEQRQKKMDKREDEVNARADKFRESLKQLDLLETSKRQMTQKAAVSAGLIDPVPQSLLLALITNQMPDGITVTKYQLESEEVKTKAPVTKKKAGGKKKSAAAEAKADEQPEEVKPTQMKTELELQGLAETDRQVAAYIANLQSSPLLARVDLNYSKEFFDRETETFLRSFKLSATVAPGAPVTEAQVAAIRFTGKAQDKDMSVLGWIFGDK